MMRRILCLTLLSIVVTLKAFGQSPKQHWVDSVFQTLSTEQKIRQLFIAVISSAWDKQQLNEVENQISSDGLGGVLFNSGNAENLLKLADEYQKLSEVPLFIGAETNTGLGAFLDSAVTFPPLLAQSALKNDSLIYEIGYETGKELKQLGVNINFGVNANAPEDHEFIHPEFYGNEKTLIVKNAGLFMDGLKSSGLLTGGKYFKINGVTLKDVVKKEIPIAETYADTAQTFAFHKLFNRNLDAVILAAQEMPVFSQKKSVLKKIKVPGSVLASSFGAQLVKNKMSYDGLVVTDLRFITADVKNGDAELYAFMGGHDLIISNEDIDPAIRKIKRILKKETAYKTTLDASVKKILSYKYDIWKNREPLNPDNIADRINSHPIRIFQRQLINSSVTVVKNTNNTLPIISLENKKFATVFIGDTINGGAFQRIVSKYVPASHRIIKSENDFVKYRNIIKSNDVIIVAISGTTTSVMIDSLLKTGTNFPDKQFILADFGSSSLQRLVFPYHAVVTGYSSQPEMLEMIPQVIFGATASDGVLPVKIASVSAGTNLPTQSLKRLQYSFPEDVQMSSETLKKIESIAQEAIAIKGTPGCHVVVARNGKVVYQKSFGYLTYENQTPVTDSTIYDLASVTKVSATLQSVMFCYDRGLIDINKKASYYLPELKKSNKENYTLKDILTHQAGLWPFLPFWAQTMKDSVHLPQYYSKKLSFKYPYVVAENLYASVGMRDSLWNWIIRSKVREKPMRTPYDYKYSDMGFYILHHLSEKIINQPMEDFLDQNLYEPLGAHTTGYQPLLRFRPNRIAPTEKDKLFRKALLIGTVHDQGAAMSGGVAGHAGLFSTGNDLAKLCQMLLQEGYYGGYQYYKPETVRFFTKKQFETSKRGLGWDRPVLSDNNGVTSVYASQRTFGHTGFTGTCIWMDPEFNLVYIFLSNRVHPDMTNNKILNANIRSRIHDVIYQSIFDYCKEVPKDGDKINNTLLTSLPGASNNK